MAGPRSSTRWKVKLDFDAVRIGAEQLPHAIRDDARFAFDVLLREPLHQDIRIASSCERDVVERAGPLRRRDFSDIDMHERVLAAIQPDAGIGQLGPWSLDQAEDVAIE